MDVRKEMKDLSWLRENIIGRNMQFETCYGSKPLVYALTSFILILFSQTRRFKLR